ncbi:TlpA family protein disulfide reductase [Neolewinella antarctica]|uniref:Thioredoxin domain-containing protein n=1 Tax=Neolewinella antarctica TaxID=442734 RepID=A0ABX0XCI5_9BACT|nr:hypothetical protein [Neolewinella antarctica]NJC26917.1 hypothetical protein [Neolewinella antarctica]
MRHFTLLLSLAFLCTCNRAQPTDEVPWKGASFLQPVTTSLTVVNASADTLELDISTRDVPDFVEGDYPGKLLPGDSATVSLDIFVAADCFVGLGFNHSLRPLLPGLDRKLVLTDSMRNAGPWEAHYTYLDGNLLPIRPAGRQPEMTDTLDHLRTELTARYAASWSQTKADAPAVWLDSFVRHEVDLAVLSDVFDKKGYMQFFYGDTLTISPQLLSRADLILNNPDYYDNVLYNRLIGSVAMYTHQGPADASSSAGARNYGRISDYLITKFPLPQQRSESLSAFAFNQQADQRMYEGKDENLARIRKELSPAYLRRLDEQQGRLIAARSNASGIKILLNSELLTTTGDVAKPSDKRTKPLTLYKFWFEGCYPCIVQQPAEAKLLERYPELELVYVAFETARKNWLPYIEKHQPPPAKHFYLSKQQKPILIDALGSVGAPTYVLVHEEEVVCRQCPKPDDPLLEKMIVGLLN